MPLLCISLLALLLLPLSLSCGSNRPPEELKNHYMFVKTDLDKTKESITTLLQNTSCPVLNHRPRSCSNITNVVSTLHILTCKMKNVSVSHTDQLVTSILSSIRCPCLEKLTKEPDMKRRRRRRTTTTTRPKSPQQRTRKETKKLCRAMALLSNITECYQMLNSQLGHN